MNDTNSLWVEKYRPINMETYICDDELRIRINSFIAKQDIPHILLHGRAGGGKTTLAKLLVNNIKCDSIYLNASTDNSIETVRGRITNFASNYGMNPLKIVILDEFDYFSAEGMAGLRALMEEYSSTTRFILTCNLFQKIIEPIVSRCQVFEIKPPSQREIAISITSLLNKEQVGYDKRELASVIKNSYPDVRKIINTLQQNIIYDDNGMKNIRIPQNAVVESDLSSKIIAILADKNISKKDSFQQIRQMLADNKVKLYNQFYTDLYEKIDTYGSGNIAQLIIIIGEWSYRESFVVDKEIMFCATLIQILDIIK